MLQRLKDPHIPWRPYGWLAIVSAVLNILFLWLLSLELTEDVSIFYWQQFNGLLGWGCLLTFMLTPIALLLAGALIMTKKEAWVMGMALLLYFIVFGCNLNFAAVFAFNIINPIDRVEFQGSVYQFAEITQYDEDTVYMIGKCDASGWKCKFRSIYLVGLFTTGAKPSMQLSEDSKRIVLKITGETVYQFDGEKEECRDSDYGYCLDNLP